MLVKHTKIFSSWAPYQPRFSQILPPQTQAKVGTAGAGFSRKEFEEPCRLQKHRRVAIVQIRSRRKVDADHVDGPKPVWPGSVGVETEQQARKAVDALHKDGVDFIKVYSRLPREAYFAVAAEAKKDRLAYVGHVPIYVSAREASVAGQRSIEHLSEILFACSRNGAPAPSHAATTLYFYSNRTGGQWAK
jgi:hypothetical protein